MSCLFNSIQLPPPSGQNQSDPCYFRAHPLTPRCFHCPGSTIGCGRVVGGWKPGPVRGLYIYFISSLVYFLYQITYCSVYSVFCILYSVRLPFAGTYYFILFLFKLFDLFLLFAFWISLSLSLSLSFFFFLCLFLPSVFLVLYPILQSHRRHKTQDAGQE